MHLQLNVFKDGTICFVVTLVTYLYQLGTDQQLKETSGGREEDEGRRAEENEG